MACVKQGIHEVGSDETCGSGHDLAAFRAHPPAYQRSSTAMSEARIG
jgi:hypothetical protein